MTSKPLQHNQILAEYLKQFQPSQLIKQIPDNIQILMDKIEDSKSNTEYSASSIQNPDSDVQSVSIQIAESKLSVMPLSRISQRTVDLSRNASKFHQIAELQLNCQSKQPLEQDQLSIFQDYINLARETDLTQYGTEDGKSQILTAKLIGISNTEDKKFFMGLREILNKNLTEATIKKQIEALVQKTTLDKMIIQKVVIEQLIQKACIEKKFLKMYAQCLADCCYGSLQKILTTSQKTNIVLIAEQFEYEFQEIILDKNYKNFTFLMNQNDLITMYSTQLCELIGQMSIVNDTFKKVAEKCFKKLHTEQSIILALAMAKHLKHEQLLEFNQFFASLQQKGKTNALLEFKFLELTKDQVSIIVSEATPVENTQQKLNSSSVEVNDVFSHKEVIQVYNDINECGLRDAMLPVLGKVQYPFSSLLSRVVLMAIIKQRPDWIREELAKLFIQFKLKPTEQTKAYHQIVQYLLQLDLKIYFLNSDILVNFCSFIGCLIYQSKVKLEKVLIELKRADQQIAYSFCTQLFRQFALCSLKSQLQDSELPDFINTVITYCIKNNNLKPIKQLNNIPLYTTYAKQDKFNYFDQPDAQPGTMNHLENELVLNIQAIFNSEQTVVNQLFDLLKAHSQTQASFFTRFCIDVQCPCILNAFVKFIPNLDAKNLMVEFRMEIYILKEVLFFGAVQKDKKYCAKMIVDLLIEAKSNWQMALEAFKKVSKMTDQQQIKKIITAIQDLEWMKHPEFKSWVDKI
ncbi:Conserved_hypothetical protein [Hexamita inflata]|uniref:Uncharacterized protein n=1 Tax=Hexamita inflata TaxID=28002 RepID=A0AA86REZ5_9EUKA|nr:Conserved hypothetical protein [Hexamita inflata]